MEFRKIELFNWVKRLPSGCINLTASGIEGPQLLQELSFDSDKILLHGDNYYGYAPLKEKIAARYGIPTDRIALTPGASMANFVILNVLASAKTRIMVETPVYQPFIRVAEVVGEMEPLRLARQRSEQYRLNPHAPELKRNTFRVLWVSNLHNPTGVLSTNEELIALADIAAKHDSWMVVDEVFLPFIVGSEWTSSAFLHERIITTCSLTKAWGLGGLRVGWIIAPPDIVRRAEYAMDYMHAVQSFVGDHIAWLALNDDHIEKRLLEHARRIATNNWKIVADCLNDMPQFDFVKPDGGLSVLIRFKDGRDSLPFIEKLVNHFRVIVFPGTFFEVNDGFRLNYGVDEDQLRLGLEKIAELLKQI